jgi:hypothetical protein
VGGCHGQVAISGPGARRGRGGGEGCQSGLTGAGNGLRERQGVKGRIEDWGMGSVGLGVSGPGLGGEAGRRAGGLARGPRADGAERLQDVRARQLTSAVSTVLCCFSVPARRMRKGGRGALSLEAEVA